MEDSAPPDPSEERKQHVCYKGGVSGSAEVMEKP